MSNSIVIGLGFGDCGKGSFTDYLCAQYTHPLVIRFSGGHQAGHTVVRDGMSHTFSNFGSGTLQNVPTYWPKYCTVEPIGLLNELDELLEYKDILPKLHIDVKCPITTPYDIMANRDSKKNKKHGSCGLGFGKTIEREENYYSLTFLDLYYPEIFQVKLEAVKKYYNIEVDEELITEFVNSCKELVSNTNVIIPAYEDTSLKYDNCIFEGSQGLMLDKNIGFFPNVTRSNTGCKNAVDIMEDKNYDVYLITRAYQTRHGNGYMSNEDRPHNIFKDPLETNKTNDYQGKFRRSLLDVSLLEYAIAKDEYIQKARQKYLVITCLDHVTNEYRFTYRGQLISCQNENDFTATIAKILNINKLYISKSRDEKFYYYDL